MTDIPEMFRPERHPYKSELPASPEDLRAYAEALQDAFMEALQQELALKGTIRQAFWVLGPDCLFRFFPEFGTPAEKDRVMGALRVFARELGAWGTIWVADSYMVTADPDDAEAVRRARTMRASQNPDRVDALMCLLAFPDGGSRVLQQPYWKKGSALVWGKPIDRSEGLRGPAVEPVPGDVT